MNAIVELLVDNMHVYTPPREVARRIACKAAKWGAGPEEAEAWISHALAHHRRNLQDCLQVLRGR